MLRRILLGIDGSAYSLSARMYAMEIGKAHQATVSGLFVIDQGILSGPRVAMPGPTFIPMEVVSYEEYSQAQEELQRKGKNMLEEAQKLAADTGVAFTPLLRVGFPDQALLKESRSHDLVVIGRKGNSDIKEETLGYTGEMLASSSAVPLLLAPREHRKIDRCLLAYDGSQQSVRAMRALRQLLEGTNWPVAVVCVEEPKRTSEGIAREADDYLSAHGITVEVIMKSGDPAKAIMEATTETKSDILAMGAFGHRGFREFFWGSTTNKILSQATTAVLVTH